MARDKTADQIAGILGVNTKTVRNYAGQGCPHDRRGPRLRIMLDRTEVTAWLRSKNLNTKKGRPESTDGMASKMRVAKTTHEAIKAKLAQIKLKKLEGKLHDTAECSERHNRQLHYFRNRLLAVARSLAPECVGKTRSQIEKLIQGHHEAVLTELNGGES